MSQKFEKEKLEPAYAPSWIDEIDPRTGNRIAWWEDPALSWRKGFDDGYALGRKQAYESIMNAFMDSIGVVPGVDLKQAMNNQIRMVQQRAERIAFDSIAGKPWIGDNNGAVKNGVGEK
jgi:hypothetical protein